MAKAKRYYYRVSIFAVKSLGGGHWENDVVVNGKTPNSAYNKALAHAFSVGYAAEVTITNCKRNGENFW